MTQSLFAVKLQPQPTYLFFSTFYSKELLKASKVPHRCARKLSLTANEDNQDVF